MGSNAHKLKLKHSKHLRHDENLEASDIYEALSYAD
jgi:hypothetical protein